MESVCCKVCLDVVDGAMIAQGLTSWDHAQKTVLQVNNVCVWCVWCVWCGVCVCVCVFVCKCMCFDVVDEATIAQGLGYTED